MEDETETDRAGPAGTDPTNKPPTAQTSPAPTTSITVAPTGRAKCQKTREPIDRGSFRFTQGRVDGNHVIFAHTLLKNVTKRVLQKHHTAQLLCDLDSEDREVAKRIVEAILTGTGPSDTDLAYRSQLPSKPKKKKAKTNDDSDGPGPVLID